MTRRKWMCGLMTAASAAVCGILAGADEHGQGHGKGHDHDDQGEFHYSDRDRKEMRDYYGKNRGHLPPGLAKRDQLPPGLEKQFRVRGVLPPGLRAKMQDCPRDLVRNLTPAPPECDYVVIGGHIVLVNRRTWVVLDVFHYER